MGLFLYNLSVKGYYLLAVIISPFNKKAGQFVTGRKNLLSNLNQSFKGNRRRVLWLHAASLGEFEQGRPVLEAFREKYPDYRILLTFFSPSGYEVRKNYNGADDIFYLPVDSKKNAAKFLEIVKPDIAILVKYEFWYHFIEEMSKSDTILLSISTILRSDHMVFKPYGKFLREGLRKINHYFPQDKNTVRLLNDIEIDQVTLAGDTRFDRVSDIARLARKIPQVEAFLGKDPCMVIGSSWPGDLEKLYPIIDKYKEELKFIIAPHNIKEDEITSIERRLVETVRLSAIEKHVDLGAIKVLIIDNIGMLSSLYRYGKYAYVGGGFRGALHNTLEAAVFGMPVFMGKHPNNNKFKEAIDLVEKGGGFEIQNSEELDKLLLEMQSNERKWTHSGEMSKNLVLNSKGATEKIMTYLQEHINL